MTFGGHVSVAGGLEKAVGRARDRAFQAVQIFVSSPRSFKHTDYSQEDIAAFNSAYKREKFEALFLHAVYLINLASASDSARAVSVSSLVHYLTMGSQLGAVGTVVHVGAPAHELGVRTSIRALREVLSSTPENQSIIVENAASSARIGSLDDMIAIHRAINIVPDSCSTLERKMSRRIKFCIDTQHLFASGVDVREPRVFSKWLANFDKEIGIEHLALIHANDSKTALGSGVDRHANIGDGAIGRSGFRNILAQPLLRNIPFILETPGYDPKHKGPDKRNIETLKSLE